MSKKPTIRELGEKSMAVSRGAGVNRGQKLQCALAQLDREKSFRDITAQWEEIEEICQQLTSYLTDCLPDPRTNGELSLLQACLLSGIAGWDLAGEDSGRVDRYIEFIKGLMEPVPRAIDYCVYYENKHNSEKEYWDLLDETLSEWLTRAKTPVNIVRRKRPYDPRPGYIDDSQLRMKVLFTILDANDIAALNGKIDYVTGREQGHVA